LRSSCRRHGNSQAKVGIQLPPRYACSSRRTRGSLLIGIRCAAQSVSMGEDLSGRLRIRNWARWCQSLSGRPVSGRHAAWADHEWRVDEDNALLRQFFWHQPRNGQFPMPMSREFWDTYREPLHMWARAADVFLRSVEIVCQHVANALTAANSFGQVEVNMALWRLNALASSGAYRYEFGPRSIKRDLSCASLLSAMAGMFLADLQAGRRALRCGTCNKVFVSKERRAAYCSKTCLNTARTRRYRQKKKVGREL